MQEILNKSNICLVYHQYRIRRCPVPLLSSTPCEFGRISVFESFFNKKFYVKIMPLNLLLTRSSYFCLFFLFKYDEVIIIKKTSSCTFGIKVVKFWKILKNKKSPLSSPPSRIWESVGRLGGIENVEYDNSLLLFFVSGSSDYLQHKTMIMI